MVTLDVDQELGGDLMRGGVSLHPSHPPMMAEAGEDAATIYSNIRSPQYFMATSDTSDTLRPGGLADQLIETVRRRPAYTTYTRQNTILCNLQTYFDEYHLPCIHGFFNRGDLSNPKVAACVDTAMDHLLTFMEANLVNHQFIGLQ